MLRGCRHGQKFLFLGCFFLGCGFGGCLFLGGLFLGGLFFGGHFFLKKICAPFFLFFLCSFTYAYLNFLKASTHLCANLYRVELPSKEEGGGAGGGGNEVSGPGPNPNGGPQNSQDGANGGSGVAIIKELTKATIRCIPSDNKLETGKCIYSGNPSTQRVLFAKAY